MPYIKLSGKRANGRVTLVDQDIYDKYSHLTWYLSDTGYAIRRTNEGTIRLHRLVADTPEGLYTDHLNHNRLDNRKSNLRIVTQKENMNNYKGAKGYVWDKSKQKWMVRYKNIFYGRYNSEDEAKEAYKRACSGVPYPKRKRRRTMLPRGVFYMKSQSKFGHPYYIRPQIKNVKYFQGYFGTIQEAEDAYIKFLNKEK